MESNNQSADSQGTAGCLVLIVVVVVAVILLVGSFFKNPEDSAREEAIGEINYQRELKAVEDRKADAERERHQRVINDYIERYEIAARNGTQVDRCVQAGVPPSPAGEARRSIGVDYPGNRRRSRRRDGPPGVCAVR